MMALYTIHTLLVQLVLYKHRLSFLVAEMLYYNVYCSIFMAKRSASTTTKTTTRKPTAKTAATKTAAAKTTAKKRATTKTTTQKTTATKVTRKTVAKRASVTRKAPTRMSDKTATKKTQSKSKRGWFTYTALAIVILVGAASIGIGLTDSGAINTSSVISERKAQATPEERAELERVGQQRNANQAVDGGLVPSADQTSKSPAPATAAATTSTASSTATSSEPTATTTDTSTDSNEAATTREESTTPDAGLVPSAEQ